MCHRIVYGSYRGKIFCRIGEIMAGTRGRDECSIGVWVNGTARRIGFRIGVCVCVVPGKELVVG